MLGLVTGRSAWESHRLVLCWLGDPPIDQALAVLMRAPRSFTGEDVAELHVHGGSVVAEAVVQLCLERGARLARPGEFTMRAFLNGRLDLAQAESVGQLIEARTRQSVRLAAQNLRGDFSARVEEVRLSLLDWLARLEAEIDFGDEVPSFDVAESTRRLAAARAVVEELISGGERGRLVGQGVRTVLVGPPNAGKSTLLNALLRTDRALVTPIAGTTRDTLEEGAVVDGVVLNLVDTAGLRADPADLVESLGIERTRRAAASAELTVLVLDGSVPVPGVDFGPVSLVVLNKADLGELPGHAFEAPVVRVSLLTEEGQEAARTAIAAVARAAAGQGTEVFALTTRQLEALIRCRGSLDLLGSTIEAGMSAEFLALDLRAAATALGEIRGVDVTEEVLDRIFSTFCLGK